MVITGLGRIHQSGYPQKTDKNSSLLFEICEGGGINVVVMETCGGRNEPVQT